MEKIEKFHIRMYSKKTATNIYAGPMRGVNKHFWLTVHTSISCNPLHY